MLSTGVDIDVELVLYSVAILYVLFGLQCCTQPLFLFACPKRKRETCLPAGREKDTLKPMLRMF